jgi:hypothetical protein
MTYVFSSTSIFISTCPSRVLPFQHPTGLQLLNTVSSSYFNNCLTTSKRDLHLVSLFFFFFQVELKISSSIISYHPKANLSIILIMMVDKYFIKHLSAFCRFHDL